MNKFNKTQGSSPIFSFVIPAYNEEKYIGACLRSIFASDYDCTQYEVIVVDNGSKDRTYEIALNSRRARVFQLLEGNVGAVRNYGAERARGKYLIFIDADCLIDKGWLNRAESLIKRFPNCAYGGGAKLSDNAKWIEKFWLLERDGLPTLPRNLIGASTLLSKDLFYCVERFNERISSGEDTDLHSRLDLKNTPVIIDHALNVTHLGNAKNYVEFLRRQIWHSENYTKQLKKSFKDPVFLLTICFIMLFFSAIVTGIFLLDHKISLSFFTVFVLTPLILTYKRMRRSGYRTKNPMSILKIYLLDLLYLTGRSAGILKRLFNY